MVQNLKIMFGLMFLMLGTVVPAYANCDLCQTDAEYDICLEKEMACYLKFITCGKNAQKIRNLQERVKAGKVCENSIQSCIIDAQNECSYNKNKSKNH